MRLGMEEMRRELERLRLENAELRRRLSLRVSEQASNGHAPGQERPLHEPLALVTVDSSTREKISLFRNLFKGRDDVYPIFWTNERTGKKGYSPAIENPWNVGVAKPKTYLPLSDQVVHDHLSGEKVIGCYPLLKDNTCWFLACDFDKEGWVLDSLAFLDACKQFGVPAYLERSRSGNGGHVWIFFCTPVPTVSARQMGM
jgi:hypothetical protein